MKYRTVNIQVEFFPSKEKRVVKIEGKPTGVELLKDMKLHLDAYILVKNNTPIPIDQELEDGDRIRLLSVVSGG
jgi:sulfur carrier protein ThiS